MSHTASPAPIVLGGVEYSVSPLDDNDMGEIDLWLRTNLIKTARASIPPDASAEEKERIERLAMREAQELSWMSRAGQRQLATLDGICRLLYQTLKKKHPDITFETIRKLVLGDGEAPGIAERVNDINTAMELTGHFRQGTQATGAPKDKTRRKGRKGRKKVRGKGKGRR